MWFKYTKCASNFPSSKVAIFFYLKHRQRTIFFAFALVKLKNFYILTNPISLKNTPGGAKAYKCLCIISPPGGIVA